MSTLYKNLIDVCRVNTATTVISVLKGTAKMTLDNQHTVHLPGGQIVKEMKSIDAFYKCTLYLFSFVLGSMIE